MKLTSLLLRGHNGERPDFPGFGHAEQVRKIHLPRLRDLKVQQYNADYLPSMLLPALETLRLLEVEMQFAWIHPLVCSASQTIRQISFISSTTLSLPPLNEIEVVPNFPSLTSFELSTDEGKRNTGLYVLYIAFLIQNVTSPFHLDFRGLPSPFLDAARSVSAVSLMLILRIHYRGYHQLATVEDEQTIRHFLERFPKVNELNGSVTLVMSGVRHQQIYRRFEFDDRDSFLKISEKCRKLRS